RSSMRKCVTPSLCILWGLLIMLSAFSTGCNKKESDDFSRLSNLGRTYYEKGEPEKAVTAFEKAVQLNPSHPDARLNLANAYLLANEPPKAIKEAQTLVESDHNSAAGYYLLGCAWLRLSK